VPDAPDYERGLARFARIAARDTGVDLHPAARSRLYAAGGRSRLAVVLLHGFTNAPAQFAAVAERLSAAGANVVVPRLPFHGARDRNGGRLRALTVAALHEAADEGAACASDLGERVVAAGISLGATLALGLAARRTDVSRAVAVAPLLRVRRLGRAGTAALAALCAAAPGYAMPWDPRRPGDPHPPYGYPDFALAGLGACLACAREIRARAAEDTLCGEAIMLVNPRDPACDEGATAETVARWNRGRGRARMIRLAGLPANHDIVDPTHPQARIRLVYPALLAAVEAD